VKITRVRSGPKPTPFHPLMQAHLEMDRPFVVATDRAIWGTFSEFQQATEYADRISWVEPYGSRIMVLMNGQRLYGTVGQGSVLKPSISRPA